MKKAERGEGLTVAEIKVYQQEVKPVKHTYGKYGTLAKQYLEEHHWVKVAALGGDFPEYLHGILYALSVRRLLISVEQRSYEKKIDRTRFIVVVEEAESAKETAEQKIRKLINVECDRQIAEERHRELNKKVSFEG